MARRAWWPTVETSEATIFARGNVTAAACAEALRDCCGDNPAAGSTVCCPDGFDATILFAAFGPLGAEFATVLLEYELNWDNERRSWIGGTEGENGEAVEFETWCEEDDEFGRVWWIAGSYFAVALGVRVPFMVSGIVPANGLIVAEIEVPGSPMPLTIAVDHPCSEIAPGGGGGSSGGSGSGGSGEPGGTACCGMTVPTLCAIFEGSLANLGIVTMNKNAAVDSYTGSSASCGNRTVTLTCVGGNYIFAVSSTDPWTLNVVSCAPFIMTGTSANSADPCPGAASVTVIEGPCAANVQYCLNFTAVGGGYLQLNDHSPNEWWSDAIGSWRLKKLGANRWQLIGPTNTVYDNFVWNGVSGSGEFGPYDVSFGACP